MFDAENIIAIFAKPPVPGKTKSRLAENVGDQFAADLSRAMLLDIIEQASDIENSEIILFYPPNSDPALLQFTGNYQMLPQFGKDLGERMSNTFALLLSNDVSKVIIIGSDCISVSRGDLENAFISLDKYESVFKPAVDGGYLLIGLKKHHSELFNGIKWGTSTVMQETIKIMQNAAVDYELLKEGFDVDRFEDLDLLKEFLDNNVRKNTYNLLCMKSAL